MRQGSPVLRRGRLWSPGRAPGLLGCVRLEGGPSSQDLALLGIPSGWSLLGQMTDASGMRSLCVLSKSLSFRTDRLAHRISWAPRKALPARCLPVLSFLLRATGRPRSAGSAHEDVWYRSWLQSVPVRRMYSVSPHPLLDTLILSLGVRVLSDVFVA